MQRAYIIVQQSSLHSAIGVFGFAVSHSVIEGGREAEAEAEGEASSTFNSAKSGPFSLARSRAMPILTSNRRRRHDAAASRCSRPAGHIIISRARNCMRAHHFMHTSGLLFVYVPQVP